MAAVRSLAYALLVPDEHGVRREERLWAEPGPPPLRRDPLRVVSGVALVLVAVAGLLGAWWLNQPGFVGDPELKLLDDGPFLATVVVLLGIGVAGILLARGRRG